MASATQPGAASITRPVLLCPAGKCDVDGVVFVMDLEAAAGVIREFMQSGREIPVVYAGGPVHAVGLTALNTVAGEITSMGFRGGVGLTGRVHWTAGGQLVADGGVFKKLIPEFEFSPEGRVVRLVRLSLAM
ncbi:MAG: phage protease [Planctomycetota bacterium]